MTIVWEQVPAEVEANAPLPAEHRTYRAQVPGGWLVSIWSGQGQKWGGGVTFVPDQQHNWAKDPELSALYELLVEWARSKKCESYSQLTQEYLAKTGKLVPHRSWGPTLKRLNEALHQRHLPPLSVVVVLKSSLPHGRNPGERFWGCAGNVPEKPKGTANATKMLASLREAVFKERWPDGLFQGG